MNMSYSFRGLIAGLKNRSLLILARNCSPNALRIYFYRLIGFKIGSNTFIGRQVVLDITNPDLISIGNNVGIALNVVILTHRRDVSKYHKDKGYNDYPFTFQKVLVKDNAQIGCGCIILPGTTIGKSSIIAAGAVVTKDVPDYCVAAGCPAKIIKEFKDV